jgi:hypothetical protein
VCPSSSAAALRSRLVAFDVSIWPGSYSPGSAFDVDLTRRYVDGGANRIVLNAMESGSMELEAIRRFIGEVQEKVIAKL